jgi:hypothetical protein
VDWLRAHLQDMVALSDVLSTQSRISVTFESYSIPLMFKATKLIAFF